MNFLLDQADYCSMNVRFTAICGFHLFVAVMYLVGLWGYYNMARKYSTGGPEEYAGFFKYLTYWNLIFHFVFFTFSFIIGFITMKCDIYYSILTIRDYVFAGIVFPFAVFVFLMFWGIFICNRNKIFRKEDEQFYPAWLNHVSHTVILPVVLLETFLVPHQYPSTLKGYAVTLFVGGAYLLWVLCLGIFKDIWVYIFLKDFKLPARVIFFMVSFAIAFIIYFIGEKVNYSYWGDVSVPSGKNYSLKISFS